MPIPEHHAGTQQLCGKSDTNQNPSKHPQKRTSYVTSKPYPYNLTLTKTQNPNPIGNRDKGPNPEEPAYRVALSLSTTLIGTKTAETTKKHDNQSQISDRVI